ncbi:MAG: hypothetical protein JWR05_2614 [Mucilaginibacter sp.]|nr:hypothetical protein [Mucilaginibacter sp.]
MISNQGKIRKLNSALKREIYNFYVILKVFNMRNSSW